MHPPGIIRWWERGEARLPRTPRGPCGYRASTTGQFSRTSRASGRPQHAERGPPAPLSPAPEPHTESAAILLKLLGAAAGISPSVIRLSGAERTTCRRLAGNEGHVDGLDLRMGANRRAPRHGVAPRLRQAPPAAPQASPSAHCLSRLENPGSFRLAGEDLFDELGAEYHEVPLSWRIHPRTVSRNPSRSSRWYEISMSSSMSRST